MLEPTHVGCYGSGVQGENSSGKFSPRSDGDDGCIFIETGSGLFMLHFKRRDDEPDV
jgi:hypothetical protein